MVAPPGLEPGLSALKGPRVNQLHHGAKTLWNRGLVASPGLEPGLSALRGRRVNQLHHDARTRDGISVAMSRLYQLWSIPCLAWDGIFVVKLDAELLDFVVVVLTVEDVPLLRAFKDDLAL